MPSGYLRLDEAIRVDPITGSANDFDYRLLWDAVEAERLARGLTQRNLLFEVDMSAGVLARLKEGLPTTCQHAVGLVRWLGCSPERFVPGLADSPEYALPDGGGYTLRWSLPLLHEAVEVKRFKSDLSWEEVADALGCTVPQARDFGRNKYGISMHLAMRIARWVERPAATFLYRAEPVRRPKR